MLTHIFHLHALSALHVGVGQAVGVVDLPIARAKATNLPLVPGSALKGVLRDEFAGKEHQATLFGPETIGDNGQGHAAALAFGDAHLLLLPVRSLAGVCAFVTCPFVLARYAEDCRRAGASDLPPTPSVADQDIVLCEGSALEVKQRRVVLEDLDLTSRPEASDWASRLGGVLHAGNEPWQKEFNAHFAIISDDNFSFLADTATEIRARIRVGERGVVQRGALWYEENLPAESVLWGALAASPGRDGAGLTKEQVMAAFMAGVGREPTIQIGGKATVGRGLVRFIVEGE